MFTDLTDMRVRIWMQTKIKNRMPDTGTTHLPAVLDPAVQDRINRLKPTILR